MSQTPFKIVLFALAVTLFGSHPSAQTSAQATKTDSIFTTCDLQALSKSEGEFLRLSRLRRFNQSVVTDEEVRQASTDYVVKADACYEALYGNATQFIDDGGLVLTPDGSEPFNTGGLKWGAGSPFAGGASIPGPGIAGGTVTYSFMASGISISAEGSDASLAFTSLPTYSSCFLAEIINAFAAWSAAANIQLVQVADNGVAFNAAGATGDIRIAAHSFDGQFSVLAHAYYPPPNGVSAPGDLHFDRAENWSCSAGVGGIDIGIVAIHEIGHSIGLGHEQTNPAIMQPFYNPGVTVPLTDDINGASSIYGSPARPPANTTGDYDGDRKTDIVVHRPVGANWYGLQSSANYTTSFTRQWGAPGDVPILGDFDGDGKADVSVYRPGNGTWYMLRSSTNGSTYLSAVWGTPTDVPVPGDYDANGTSDVAVFRPSNGIWYFQPTNSSVQWGMLGDIPVAGDYDADGRTDIAIFRPSSGTWYIRSPAASYQWGQAGDVPLPADFDGDGKQDIAVYRPASGMWYIRRSSTNYTTTTAYQWGISTDTPVPGDYDGDGKADIAVFRPSDGYRFIVYSSTNSASSVQWGANGDIPLPQRP